MLELLKKVGLMVFETVKVIVVSLAIILPIRYFLIQPFYVEGASMEPSFYPREYLIIDEISYRFNQPQRGDVVVFRYPLDPRQFYIKRIIGLPGETVKVINGTVYVDGVELAEEYLAAINVSRDTKPDVKLALDEYFLMGDNRASSLDSRSFGPVKGYYIVGRVWIRGWPITRLDVISSPHY